MPLVQAKCTSCGANLQVDSSSDAAVCPYCNSAYVVEKAINNFNTSIKIDNLSADVINIQNENDIENRIKAAETFIQLKSFNKAIEILKPLTEKYPFDYRTWWGLVEAETQMFERVNAIAYKEAKKNYEAASQVATGSDKEKTDRIFSEYAEKVKVYCKETAGKVETQKESLKEKYTSQISSLKSKKGNLEKKYSNSKVILVIVIIVCFIMFTFGISTLSSDGPSPIGIICLSASIILCIFVSVTNKYISKVYKKTSENYNNLVAEYEKKCSEIDDEYPPQLYTL